MNLNLYRFEFSDPTDERHFFDSGDHILPLTAGAPHAPPGHVFAESAREAARAYWECHDYGFRPNLRITHVVTVEKRIGTYRAVRHTSFEPELVVE